MWNTNSEQRNQLLSVSNCVDKTLLILVCCFWLSMFIIAYLVYCELFFVNLKPVWFLFTSCFPSPRSETEGNKRSHSFGENSAWRSVTCNCTLYMCSKQPTLWWTWVGCWSLFLPIECKSLIHVVPFDVVTWKGPWLSVSDAQVSIANSRTTVIAEIFVGD